MNNKLTDSVKVVILILASGCLLYSCKCDDEPRITSFVFEETSTPSTGEINQDDGTILIKVPENTDVTNLSPTVEVANPSCHTLSPSTNTSQDFTETVIYEVTNEVGDARQYEVSVIFDHTVASLDITWESKAPLPAEVG